MSNEPFEESPEYGDLIGTLNSWLSTVPLGLAILPDSQQLPPGSHVQIVENTLGIPKGVLQKAFITARRIFFHHLDAVSENCQLIIDSSAVMLLFDPEHITAANARKRVSLAYLTHSKSEQLQRLSDELWFTEILLTSKLKRHNKSPTLWSHRKWIIKNHDTSMVMMNPIGMDRNEVKDVIPLSADHHPRNYYAWDYLRWWITSRRQRGLMSTPSDLAMAGLVEFYLDWCLKHTSDTSGWSFLTWMLRSRSFYTLDGPYLQAWVAKKVLDFAMSMKLKNESIWIFLRENIGLESFPQKAQVHSEYVQCLSKFRSSEPEGSWLKKFAEDSLFVMYSRENLEYDY